MEDMEDVTAAPSRLLPERICFRKVKICNLEPLTQGSRLTGQVEDAAQNPRLVILSRKDDEESLTNPRTQRFG
jgi:hypothetical protein